MHRLCPHHAAIERTLPCRVPEGKRFWSELVGVGIGAEEVSDDLEVLPEETRKKSGFGASVVDGPGSACTRGQANIALSTHSVTQQEGRVSRRWRNDGRSGWRSDFLGRRGGGCAECTSDYESGCEQSPHSC